MATESEQWAKAPQRQMKPIPRQTDGDAFFQIYSGGVRAVEPIDNSWHLEPVLHDGHPCTKGSISSAKLQAFFRHQGFTFVAFHRMGWFKGQYHSSWCPFIPGQTNHMQGPADLWNNVAGNLSQARTAGDLTALIEPTHEQIAAILDNRSEAERLARSISLSIRNMDISVEVIAEFYNEQLVNHMASGNLEGERASSSLDQTLFAHVHSFFVHLGAARDYLAALCALRLGKDPNKFNSFAWLTEVVRTEDLARDDLIRLFHQRGYLQQKPTSVNKLEVAGWMKEVTDLRNEFIHRRPYGDRFVELMGFAKPVDREAGLYRYVRPMMLGTAEDDAESVVLRHYREMTGLCHAAALASGSDVSMFTLTDADIISVDFEGE